MDSHAPRRDEGMPTNQRKSRWIRWLHRISAIVFVLATICAIITIWANVRIQDSEAWSQTVAPMANDPGVQIYIVDRTMAAIDRQVTEDSDSGRLPRAFNLLEPLIRPALTEVVESHVFAKWWVDANAYAHESLTMVAQGESTDLVSMNANALVVNLQPLVDTVNNRIASEIPGVSYSIQLSDQYSSIEILHSDAISRIVGLFQWIDRLSVILPIVALTSFGLAISIAGDWVRALRNLLINLAIACALVTAGLFLLRYLSAAGQPDADQAMYATMLRIVLSDLMNALVVVAGISAAGGACCAVLASRSKPLPPVQR